MTPEERDQAHALLTRALTDPNWRTASQALDDLMRKLLVVQRLLEAVSGPCHLAAQEPVDDAYLRPSPQKRFRAGRPATSWPVGVARRSTVRFRQAARHGCPGQPIKRGLGIRRVVGGGLARVARPPPGTRWLVSFGKSHAQ
jgi:hypothetical protein